MLRKYRIKSRGEPVSPPAWGMGGGLTSQLVTQCHTEPRNWRALVNTIKSLGLP
jgi:hypothetical protein